MKAVERVGIDPYADAKFQKTVRLAVIRSVENLAEVYRRVRKGNGDPSGEMYFEQIRMSVSPLAKIFSERTFSKGNLKKVAVDRRKIASKFLDKRETVRDCATWAIGQLFPELGGQMGVHGIIKRRKDSNQRQLDTHYALARISAVREADLLIGQEAIRRLSLNPILSQAKWKELEEKFRSGTELRRALHRLQSNKRIHNRSAPGELARYMKVLMRTTEPGET